MAAIVFPTNPTVGQVFTSGSKSWVWNSVSWESTRLQTSEIDGGTQSSTYSAGYVFVDGGEA